MNDTTLNLATMFIGALFGAILVPLGQELVNRFFAKRTREHNFLIS